MTDPVAVDPEMNEARLLNVMANLRIILPYSETLGDDGATVLACVGNIPVLAEVQTRRSAAEPEPEPEPEVGAR
jgi:hypothetical protein